MLPMAPGSLSATPTTSLWSSSLHRADGRGSEGHEPEPSLALFRRLESLDRAPRSGPFAVDTSYTDRVGTSDQPPPVALRKPPPEMPPAPPSPPALPVTPPSPARPSRVLVVEEGGTG